MLPRRIILFPVSLDLQPFRLQQKTVETVQSFRCSRCYVRYNQAPTWHLAPTHLDRRNFRSKTSSMARLADFAWTPKTPNLNHSDFHVEDFHFSRKFKDYSKSSYYSSFFNGPHPGHPGHPGPGRRRLLHTALTEKQHSSEPEPTEHSDKSEPTEKELKELKEPENSEKAEGSENATEKSEPTENVTEKILQMNGKVINITGRLGDEQLEDWVIGGVDQSERVYHENQIPCKLENSVNATSNVVNGKSSKAVRSMQCQKKASFCSLCARTLPRSRLSGSWIRSFAKRRFRDVEKMEKCIWIFKCWMKGELSTVWKNDLQTVERHRVCESFLLESTCRTCRFGFACFWFFFLWKDQCRQSRAHVTVKECVKIEDKGEKAVKLPEGHWMERNRDCRYVKMPLAMILSDHGRCLSAASSANSITEECDPLHVDCSSTGGGCNRCWLLQRATENNVFTGWKLKTACEAHEGENSTEVSEARDPRRDRRAQFLTRDEMHGTLKFTDEYDTQQDRQIWNLTEAENQQIDPEKLSTEIFKRPFMLETCQVVRPSHSW